MKRHTRRQFIRSSGIALAGAAGVGTLGTAGAAENGWTEVESPTGKTLYGADLAANGPWACGGGGKVLERTVDGWKIRLENGPGAEGNGLTDMAATDDGNRVWFCGGSGVIGEMDVVTKTLTDHSAPLGKTSTWEAMAVTGEEDTNEIISLVNGSGEELTGYRQPDGSIEWGNVVKPGGGASMKGMDHYAYDSFICCDTNSKVYESTDRAQTWSTIGVDGGEVGYYGAAAVASDDMNVSGGSGYMLRYDGNRWTARKVGSSTIKSVDRLSEQGLGCGGSGHVYRRQTIGSWDERETPVGNNLESAVLGGELYPDVCVGASGTIIEKRL